MHLKIHQTEIHRKTGKEIYYDKGEARTRKEMADVDKVYFQCQQIAFIEYDNLTEDQQREIFLRRISAVESAPVDFETVLASGEDAMGHPGPYQALRRKFLRCIPVYCICDRIFAKIPVKSDKLV
ncbi:hypothetical protein AAF712_015929 [Marasmius tenuissimus]|uniref:Uncharacterized protein n=1 Tax=Marasmius tenuissimus TaxID=585030 RepID=A0ABR2Z783_9AGAR